MVLNIPRFWQRVTMKSPLNSDPVVVLGGGVVIKKVHLIAFFFILLILGYLLSSSLRAGRALTVGQSEQDIGQPRNFKLKRKEYSRWPAYQTPSYNHEWFKRNCWAVPKLSISSLSAVIDSWSKASLPQCREVYGMMMSIYDVSTTKTSVVIKEPFVDKVKGWLGNNEMLYAEAQHQTIIKVFNLYTREQVLVNPLRDKRPISKPDKPERQFVEEIAAESKASCDFCNYKDFTAQDDFPRIENERSVSASNTFKWDKWHGLILTKGHHPLNWGEEDFLDLMKTAQQWFERVNSRDSEYVYPVIIWDLLPHASASQVHPHVHTNLNKGRYYGYSENWRNGGEDYLANTGANFFTDMVAVHKALGLTVQLGNATALAHLVPRKDDEVVVVSAGADRDFFRLLYYTLRAYLDDMEKLCYSLAITLPPLNSDSRGRTPAFARVVTRGPVASMRSAISGVDLFIASNVNIDPYKVIGYVRNSVEKRSKG